MPPRLAIVTYPQLPVTAAGDWTSTVGRVSVTVTPDADELIRSGKFVLAPYTSKGNLIGFDLCQVPDHSAAEPKTLTERVERVEAILRADRRHEPTCPAWLSPGNPLLRVPGKCSCWIASLEAEDEARSRGTN